ncbi:MAG: efflux RND transporter periplasmic adaptor subunit [Muribaculaceae bacterium]|nr:efflux RND transporter periplasmic adaptor subunit [Muribaculaceae bacterium]
MRHFSSNRGISRLWRLGVLILVAVSVATCGVDVPKETQSSFETMTVDTTDHVMPIRFSAKLKGQSDVTISPQVSGQLMRICVTEGQQVGRGQVLFVIDSRNAQHELQSAQANLQAAQANLQAAQAQANSAKLEYDSNKNLFDKKIVSSYTLENSLNTYRQAQAAVGQAKASVSQAQASVSRARVNLGFCTLTSPVAGVVGEISVRAGDQVTPMSQLTIVSGNRQMEAWFSVPESILEAGVAEGATSADKNQYLAELPDVTFVMKNGTEYPYKGRISSITGVVDAATGSLSCKATFPNPDGHLYSGIQGTVLLPMSRNGVMVIPQLAVVRLQDKSLVYKVMPDSTATAVSVTTTDAGNGKDVIVTEGLKLGDRIVTVGANNVQEGQRVLFPAEEKKK